MATLIYIAQHTCCLCHFTGLSRWVIYGYDEQGTLWICPACREACEQARAEEARRMPFWRKDPAQTAPLDPSKGKN